MQGFGEVAEKLRRSTVQVLDGGGAERGSGSGVIWAEDGLIITNSHVARGERVRIELWDRRSFDAQVASRDPRRDLALLQIRARGLPSATAGDSNLLRAGELVVAVGNPMGFIGALTTGVVHGIGPQRGLGRQSWVHAAVRLAPGNSGGPLADASGHVVGINTMVVSGGLALAVPSNSIADFLASGARPSLGVTVREVRLGRGLDIGLLVLEVDPRGPAADASILMGDVLVGAASGPFHSLEGLSDALDSAPNGVLSLHFLRGDRSVRRQVAVRLQVRGAAA